MIARAVSVGYKDGKSPTANRAPHIADGDDDSLYLAPYTFRARFVNSDET